MKSLLECFLCVTSHLNPWSLSAIVTPVLTRLSRFEYAMPVGVTICN